MPKRSFYAKVAPAALGPYSHATLAGGFAFISGQLGLVPSTNILAEGGIEEETRQALENIKSILSELGASPLDVVKATVFLRDMNDFAAMNKVYATYFPSECPARSAVQIGALPKDAAVEIEVIAAVGQAAIG
ncbi:MAG: hypothetical protein FD137_2340, partial [Spirochaetes bacterium]